jgi:hypothetical protein
MDLSWFIATESASTEEWVVVVMVVFIAIALVAAIIWVERGGEDD